MWKYLQTLSTVSAPSPRRSSSLALSSIIAVAQIEAEGDRIDRLNAENHERLDSLLHGKW
jgi:hypothetical protein